MAGAGGDHGGGKAHQPRQQGKPAACQGVGRLVPGAKGRQVEAGAEHPGSAGEHDAGGVGLGLVEGLVEGGQHRGGDHVDLAVIQGDRGHAVG